MPQKSQVLSSDVTQGNLPWLLSSPGDEKREMINEKEAGTAQCISLSCQPLREGKTWKMGAVISLAQNLTGNKNVEVFSQSEV